PREQIGLALGAWGAVQTTAAGAAIALGGVIRDLMLADTGAAAAYMPVFALEAGLLALAFLVAWPMRRALDMGHGPTISGLPQAGGPALRKA
ncbi:MAG: PucC family protein, partial [Paracoccaceae bacterium]